MKEMFDSIRDKFHSLQENLTITLRGLTVNEESNRRPVVPLPPSVNLNAGTDVLDRFQNSWCELHEASQKNANKADEVDNLIDKLHKNVEKHWKSISQMTNALSSLPQVIYTLNQLSDKIIALEGLFDNVEKSLIQYEDLIDTRDFQNKQLEQRFQLAMYKERKLAELESVRICLAEQLAEKIRQKEMRELRLSKECKETSEENFNHDMNVLKKTNVVPTIEFENSNYSTSKGKSETKLEDITFDDEDTSCLDAFLNDSKDSEENNE